MKLVSSYWWKLIIEQKSIMRNATSRLLSMFYPKLGNLLYCNKFELNHPNEKNKFSNRLYLRWLLPQFLKVFHSHIILTWFFKQFSPFQTGFNTFEHMWIKGCINTFQLFLCFYITIDRLPEIYPCVETGKTRVSSCPLSVFLAHCPPRKTSKVINNRNIIDKQNDKNLFWH